MRQQQTCFPPFVLSHGDRHTATLRLCRVSLSFSITSQKQQLSAQNIKVGTCTLPNVATVAYGPHVKRLEGEEKCQQYFTIS
jgi:hypothetical protein